MNNNNHERELSSSVTFWKYRRPCCFCFRVPEWSETSGWRLSVSDVWGSFRLKWFSFKLLKVIWLPHLTCSHCAPWATPCTTQVGERLKKWIDLPAGFFFNEILGQGGNHTVAQDTAMGPIQPYSSAATNKRHRWSVFCSLFNLLRNKMS